jgi:hypothetical protein
MISRTRILVALLAASSCALVACSSDEGAPTASSTDTVIPAGSKAAIEGCVKDADCASSVCYQGDQGSYCSLKCNGENATTVCVAPFVGTCNKKGFCRKP